VRRHLAVDGEFVSKKKAAFIHQRKYPHRAEKLIEWIGARGGLLFLHHLDVLRPDSGVRLPQSQCPLGQLQIVCCKRHQIFGHARLSTGLGEPYAPFG